MFRLYRTGLGYRNVGSFLGGRGYRFRSGIFLCRGRGRRWRFGRCSGRLLGLGGFRICGRRGGKVTGKVFEGGFGGGILDLVLESFGGSFWICLGGCRWNCWGC